MENLFNEEQKLIVVDTVQKSIYIQINVSSLKDIHNTKIINIQEIKAS